MALRLPKGVRPRQWQAGVVGLTTGWLVLSLLQPAQGGNVDAVLNPLPTYPDLVPDIRSVYVERPFLGSDPDTGASTFGPPRLAFDTWSQNVGTVALDVLANDPTTPTASTVSQCVSWTPDRVCRERRQVGGFAWHEEHTHFHFQDFARYELRELRGNGQVNYSSRGLLAVSDKVSFCLIDTTPTRDDAFPLATYTLFCNPFRQGISAGWADVYGSGLADQQLSSERLHDGRYALVVTLNPTGGLWESDHDNNTVEVIVELSSGATKAAIVERRWP